MAEFPKNHVEAFQGFVGIEYVSTDADKCDQYAKDWTRQSSTHASCVVFPKSTREVSDLLKYCNEHSLKVVPSGGRTGLAGGAVATKGEVVLSLDRMNKIESIDRVGMVARVEAGVSCEALQQAALDNDLFFALDLASKGSCQLGGNIATNAGGLKLIRYGGAREQVLGIEAVLADGTILDMNYSLRKNNTGLDLKQMFISTEGTLGVVTRATLRLQPKPNDLLLSFFAVDSFEKIARLVELCNEHRMSPTAFEFFSNDALEVVERFHKNLHSPFSERTAYYVLLEFDSYGHKSDVYLEPFAATALESEIANDAVIASSSAQFKNLWALRENISESVAQNGHVRKNDISLPIEDLKSFVEDLDKIVKKAPKEIQLIIFGHIGDGNLHINYIAPKSMDIQQFHAMARKVEEEVFALLPKYRGSISAEHGIGLLKKKDLKFSRSPEEILWMKKIKALFDPKETLNPGKIFDMSVDM